MSESDENEIDWKGILLNDKYLPIVKLDAGSFASVWVSYDIINNKYYAIKIHNSYDYLHGLNETKTYDLLKKIKCQYLMTQVEVFDHYNEDNIYHCCVMELMRCSLYKLIEMNNYKGLPLDTVVKITRQILYGLDAMHKHGHIHADIKPENILIEGTSQYITELKNKLNMAEFIKKIQVNKKTTIETIYGGKTKAGATKTQIVHKLTDIHVKQIIKHIDETINNMQLKTREYTESTEDSNEITSEDSLTDTASTFSLGTSHENSDEHSDCNHEQNFDNDNINIKISDMGTCIIAGTKHKRKRICTKYYRSPEIILHLGYTEKADMWALGCTIYEMLTGNILFDAHGIKENYGRRNIALMIEHLGMLPTNMMEQSPRKDLFFTTDLLRVKGHTIEKFSPLWMEIEQICGSKNQITQLIMHMLDYEPTTRISAEQALKQSLFAL